MEKALSVSQLRKSLGDIPDTYYLMPNGVGNLSILDNDKKYVGFIDFNDGEVDLFDSKTQDKETL